MILGFRNLDSSTGTIAACLESLTLDDFGAASSPNLLALAVTGKSYSDSRIIEIAESLPYGQKLWAFSPTSRKMSHPSLLLTHVPAGNDREFVLKVAGHIERFVKSQAVGSPMNPKRLAFPETHRAYGSLGEYDPVLDERHTVNVDVDGISFDLFSDLRSSSTKLVVFGQDALSRSAVSLPFFFRWKWAELIKASVLVLNDPTLYLSDTLNAGWWVGTRDRDFVHDAISIVRRATSVLGIDAEDVFFFGASAGGFSSLHMAAAFQGSKALVDIPQTNLRSYSEVREADAAVLAGLGYASTHDVPQELLHRIDAIERFEHEGNIPEFTYFQNMRDITHVDAQMGDFKTRLAGRESTSSRFVQYSQWHLTKGGHFPLKPSDMIRAVNSHLAKGR